MMIPRVSLAQPLVVLALIVLFCVIGTRGLCEQNSVNYSGVYIFDYSRGSTLDASGNPTRVDHTPAQVRIFAAPANNVGSRESSFWMQKFFNQTEEDFDGAALSDSVEGALKLGSVNSLCVATPHEGAGLECVDLEDSAAFRIMPLEVDADCNMLTGWSTYIEPSSPGCTNASCFPMIAATDVTRVGSGNVEAIPLASSDSHSTRSASVLQRHLVIIGILCATYGLM